MIESLPEEILLVILSFLEPSLDQLSIAMCSKTLFTQIFPFIKTLLVHPCLQYQPSSYRDFFFHSTHTSIHQSKEVDSIISLFPIYELRFCSGYDRERERGTSHFSNQNLLAPLNRSIHQSVFSSLYTELSTSACAMLCLNFTLSGTQQESVIEMRLHKIGGQKKVNDSSSCLVLDKSINHSTQSSHTDQQDSPSISTKEVLNLLPLLSSLERLTLSHQMLWQCDIRLLNSSIFCFSRFSSTHLMYLDLSHCFNFDPDFVFCVDCDKPQLFPNLHTLILDFCKQIRDTHLSCFANHEYFKQLSLVGCNITGSTLHKIVSLTQLNLSQCNSISCRSIESLGALPQLLALSLRECTQNQFSTVDHFLLRSLKWLDLSGCQISNDALNHLASLNFLQHLNLSGSSQIRDTFVIALIEGVHSTLEWLDLEWCLGVSSRAIEIISRRCIKLKHLNLRGIDLDDQALHSFTLPTSVVSQNLESIRITSEQASVEAICNFVRALPRVAFLGLEKCHAINDFVLSEISALHSLRVLSLCGCEQFSWSGLVQLVENSNIEWIDLRMCWQVRQNQLLSQWGFDLVKGKVSSHFAHKKHFSVIIDSTPLPSVDNLPSIVPIFEATPPMDLYRQSIHQSIIDHVSMSRFCQDFTERDNEVKRLLRGEKVEWRLNCYLDVELEEKYSEDNW